MTMYQPLSLPAHYKAANVGQLYLPDERMVGQQARADVRKFGIPPAGKDAFKIGLVIIDGQITFCYPKGQLFVGGRSGNAAVEDNIRLTEFIYRNTPYIHQTIPTLDTHMPIQVFHEIFWVNDKGDHPEPFTTISAAEVESGKWRVNPAITYALCLNSDPQVLGSYYMTLTRDALHYTKSLAQLGENLEIWPYHAGLGSPAHALDPALYEAVFYHSIARVMNPEWQIKGGHPLRENYSVVRPKVITSADGSPMPNVQVNTDLIEKVVNLDALIFAGEAGSHCFRDSVDDFRTVILEKNPDLARKVYLMEDCTSPVVVPGVIDHTDRQQKAIDLFREANMNVVRSTVPLDQWPGVIGQAFSV